MIALQEKETITGKACCDLQWLAGCKELTAHMPHVRAK